MLSKYVIMLPCYTNRKATNFMELKVFTIPMGTKGLTDLVPITVGWALCSPDHSYGPEVRGCYIIHYVLSGKGFF